MLDPYEGDDLLELYININVANPQLEDFSHISYEILIETNNFSFNKKQSSVRRRFSDFVVLYKLISKEFPAMKTPSLPPRSPFHDHFDPAFIESRRKGLEDFITKIVSQKIYLSSKALHLFLQTNFTMNEIKDIIHGKKVTTETQYRSVNNSHAELQIKQGSSDVQNQSTAHSDDSSKCYSPLINKRVSFCEQVTVAQIH